MQCACPNPPPPPPSPSEVLTLYTADAMYTQALLPPSDDRRDRSTGLPTPSPGRTLLPPRCPHPRRQGRLSGVPRTLTPSPPRPAPGPRTRPARLAGDARPAPPPHPGGAGRRGRGGPSPSTPEGNGGRNLGRELLARCPPRATGWAGASPGRGGGGGADGGGGRGGEGGGKSRAGPVAREEARAPAPHSAHDEREGGGPAAGRGAGVPPGEGRRGRGGGGAVRAAAAGARVATHSRQAADRAPPS